MYKTLFSLLLLASSSFVHAAVTAPEFTFTANNQTLKLSDLKGRVVYLDFWASWCKPCKASFPWMNQMQQKYADQGLTILAINLDKNRHAAEQFLANIPASFDIHFDPQGDIASLYKIPGMPTSYLIDQNGHITVAHRGFLQTKQASYEQEIIQLLSDKE